MCFQSTCFGEACVLILHSAGSTQMRPRMTSIRQMRYDAQTPP